MQPSQQRRSDYDSEDDPDYVPPANDVDSDVEREAKRVRIKSPEGVQANVNQEAKESDRQALWASFKSLVSVPQQIVSQTDTPKTIKIEKRYKYAGEDVVEVKEVPEDSDEAKKWPRWNPPIEQQNQPGPSLSTPTPTSSTPTVPKAAKKPGPRKPKTTLRPLPGLQKANKLTTLDKSAMDWKAHVDDAEKTSGLKDELDANRRGGGYLEKVDFLQRVEQRKDEAFEASKSNKRRRG